MKDLNQFGTLFVADYQNNRVVGFFNAASIESNGPNADFVVGQPDFTSSSNGTTVITLRQPYPKSKSINQTNLKNHF